MRKGTKRYPTVWQHGPAYFEFLAAALERLVRVAGQMGMSVSRVEQVQAKLIQGTKVLLIWPAGEHDRTAYEVKRYKSKSSGWVNLCDLLGPEGLTVESGYRELYEVHYIPPTSPFYPGLVIDLGQPEGRRQEGRRQEGRRRNHTETTTYMLGSRSC